MPDESGQADVVGYIFPTPGFLAGDAPNVPAALSARTGAWCFDTMTAVGEGTWEAARAAVDTALTAADLVLGGAPAAYACCRPPGHHVTRSAFGGSCYLNNSAIVAQYLVDGGVGRVALIDVDAHHGNGAQAIFRERDDVLTASVHVDPGEGWFPHFLGFAEESGPSNLNVPLPAGSGDETWLAGVDRLVEATRAHGSEALVVALGRGRRGRRPERSARRHRGRVPRGGAAAGRARPSDRPRPGGRLRARDGRPARPCGSPGIRGGPAVTLRTRRFLDLIRAHVPEPPARVLEVGCGSGELALALAEHGFDVVAVDPKAPDGPIFRRVALEDFADEHAFDAVVASLSLHHIHDLDGALDAIASFLPPRGPLVVQEWASERLTGATARWWYEQRRALASVGRSDSEVPDDYDAWMRHNEEHLADLHRTPALREAIDARFAERFFEWRPYLHSWRLDDALEPLERVLIEEGAIEATSWLYVGERR